MVAEKFAHPLAFNCIPRIDVMMEDGSTKEEWKMVAETQKIMHAPNLGVNATCIRVPSIRCHGESVNVEFESPVGVNQASMALAFAPSVEVMDDPEQNVYPMPAMLAGKDYVYVGRLREDSSNPNALSFWLVMDQIRKGAALNAVQIAQLLLPTA